MKGKKQSEEKPLKTLIISTNVKFPEESGNFLNILGKVKVTFKKKSPFFK